ncbi:ABC transporter domain-containing protein [endosymbiont of Acanthamoeba sp. UWC8]|uniref:ATP-binding cassette domain-containing protein n=1 Tax=endosymbiont of Acanthamoeba sp. UWC8 TaxID=86106 RepID=UPI0004D1DBDD|nr:ATP-binding cassette domain-containing protein [endosymbiont of Acanthamoeba sp. UWC8]AIF80695.1 ABC transporter domain-containing protein [endosymbiont of Acanthamoeba sp. UWC8]
MLNFSSSFPSKMLTSAHAYTKPLVLTLLENKIPACIFLLNIVGYIGISYYESYYMHTLLQDMEEYIEVFAQFSGGSANDACLNPTLNLNANMFSTLGETALRDSILVGIFGAVKYVGMMALKPLFLSGAIHTLTYSLQLTIINKWLGGTKNNQLGIAIINPEIAHEAREIITTYAGNYVESIVKRGMILFDILNISRKLTEIYGISQDLEIQGLDSNAMVITLVTCSVYAFINCFLAGRAKEYGDRKLKLTQELNANIIYNTHNALSIETRQATSQEYLNLKSLLEKVTLSSSGDSLVKSAIGATGLLFAYNTDYFVIWGAIESVIKYPHLYFELKIIGKSIMQLSYNIWQAFEKFSSSTAMSYTSNKIINFLNSIEEYEALIANRKDFKLNESSENKLSVNLCLRYPDAKNSISYKILVNKVEKTFEPGKVYGIIGESGSGKSSFFNSLIGINPYTTGKVSITTRKNIIYIPQKVILKNNLNFFDTIFYPKVQEDYIESKYYNDLKGEIDLLVSDLKLGEVYERSKRINNWSESLSGGEEQRVGVLQALVSCYIASKESKDGNIVLLP